MPWVTRGGQRVRHTKEVGVYAPAAKKGSGLSIERCDGCGRKYIGGKCPFCGVPDGRPR